MTLPKNKEKCAIKLVQKMMHNFCRFFEIRDLKEIRFFRMVTKFLPSKVNKELELQEYSGVPDRSAACLLFF